FRCLPRKPVATCDLQLQMKPSSRRALSRSALPRKSPLRQQRRFLIRTGGYLLSTASMFVASSSAFLRVLDRHKPDLVLVMSRRAWRHLPSGSTQLDTIQNPDRADYVADTVYRNSVLFAGLPHPR